MAKENSIKDIGDEIISRLEEIGDKIDHLLIGHFFHNEEDENGHECSATSCS